MNTKVPPPIVGLCVAALMMMVNRLLPDLQLNIAAFRWLAIVLVVVGLSIELYSVALFFKSRTTVNPLKPENTNSLVTSGLYTYSRNPMYFGMLLLLIGFAFWLGNPVTVVIPALFVWYITRFQIKPEEKVLGELFGDQFTQYCARVRRWI